MLTNILLRLPDLKHLLTPLPGHKSTGQVSWFDPWDINIYGNAIRLGTTGQFLYLNQYDTPNAERLFLYPLYTFWGFMTKGLPLTPLEQFHLLAFFTSIGVVVVVWKIANYFTPNHPYLTTILLLFGAGLGAVVYPDILAADLSRMSFTLHGALRIPHEGVSVMLLLLNLLGLDQFLKRSHPTPSFLISSLLLPVFHPYLLAIPISVAMVTRLTSRVSITPKQSLLPLAAYAVGALGTGFTIVIPLSQSASFTELANQKHIPVSLLEYAIGFGVLTPLLLLSLKKTLKHQENSTFLSRWFFIQLLLTLLPLPFAPLLIKAIWVPAVLLAISTLETASPKFLRHGGAIFIMLLSLPTTLFIYNERVDERSQSPWSRMSESETAAYSFLAQIPTTTILASEITANRLPVFTPHHVFAGHTVQTPQYHSRATRVLEYLSGSGAPPVSGNAVVYWGPLERWQTKRPTFPFASTATILYSSSEVTIYKLP